MNVFAYTANNHLLTVKKIDHQKTSSSINGQIFYLYYLLLPGLISIPHKITSTQLDTPKQPSSLLPKACFSPVYPPGEKHPQALPVHKDPDCSLGSSGTLFSWNES